MPPSAQELKVKAWFFIPIEAGDGNLSNIAEQLRLKLMQEGFEQTDKDLNPFGPQRPTLEFHYTAHMQEPEIPFSVKLKQRLNRDVENKMDKLRSQAAFDSLRNLRDDYPFRLVFKFKPVETEESEGYDVKVESTPTLLQKFRQLNLGSEYTYSKEDVVQENKDELERIAAIFGTEPYRGPYTEEELIEPLLSESQVEILRQHRYGNAVLDYINEGDESLQNGLLHAALSCYIHAIEWTILHYKQVVEDTDLVDEQKQDENKYFTYHHLVQKIQNDTPVTQRTLEKLRNFNDAERQWIAHHREGDIPRTSVENVRENLGKLVEELFRNYSTEESADTTIE